MEEWKTFLEYDCQRGHTFFEVSTEGRIRNGRTGQMRKRTFYPDGYEFFSSHLKGKKQFQKSVHRIVAEAFIPNPENKPNIDHINGNKGDNRVENLRWVTQQENMNNPVTKIRSGRTNKETWNSKKPYKKSPIVLLLEKQIPL